MQQLTKVKVLAGCLLIGLVGVVLAALVARAHAGPPALSVQFLRYTVADGGVAPMAVLQITNSTGCTWKVPLATETASYDKDGVCSAQCMFSNRTSAGWTFGTYCPTYPSRKSSLVYLDPCSSLDVAVPLAETRVPRKVAIFCIQDFRRSTRRVDRVRRWIDTHLPARYRLPGVVKEVWCERELNWPTDTKPTPRPKQ
jgi:hypothetical protein